MKKILEKRLNRLMAKKDNLTARALASTDANEVRSINDQIAELNEDISEVREQIDILEKQEKAEEEQRSKMPVPNATPVNANIVGSYAGNNPQERANEDVFASLEYRQAFKAYVQNGTAIPSELAKRDGSPATTQTLGAIIPTTVLNEFIELLKSRYGNLYNKVRKLNIKGGVKIPISELQATFKWVTETTVSPRENGGSINSYVEFGYNLAEVRISQTLLASIVALSAFESEIVKVMLKAFLKAMDYGIMNGTGNGQMLGILNDARITNVVTMTSAQIADWTQWRKRFFATLPLAYRSGEFIFPVATVDTYLETMADANNNPIFRQATGLEVNDGDAQNPNGRFFGRNISLVEEDIIKDFDTASAGDVIGVYWQPEEYAINSNMEMGVRRWFDEDRNEWVNKMLVIVDGKVLDPTGFVLIKKA